MCVCVYTHKILQYIAPIKYCLFMYLIVEYYLHIHSTLQPYLGK